MWTRFKESYIGRILLSFIIILYNYSNMLLSMSSVLVLMIIVMTMCEYCELKIQIIVSQLTINYTGIILRVVYAGKDHAGIISCTIFFWLLPHAAT